jgi:deoxyribodipyrimidine photo-lyase
MNFESYGIHWFRRDLRVNGNPGLEWNFQQNQGRVLGLFALDPKFLSRPDFSNNRFAFFMSTLHALKEELQALGGDLLVLEQGPEAAFRAILGAAHGGQLPRHVSWNRDYEPFARARDARIEQILNNEFQVSTHVFRDHLLIEPQELFKGAGGSGQAQPYRVFTPFKKRWLELFSSESIQSRLKYYDLRVNAYQKANENHRGQVFSLRWKDCPFQSNLPPDVLANWLEIALKKSQVPLPKAGMRAAVARALQFERSELSDYGDQRDFPAAGGTSMLSVYFKNGSICSGQVLSLLGLKSGETGSRATFLSELIWREFYYHILYHFPHVESEAFQAKYSQLAWANDLGQIEAWKNGMTGYPIVDAGMRQLQRTGLMHNRVRMIVASFLTKDLLVDWRIGERHFMNELLDGDLAPNNGGWQWAASTGCDPQPYFRVFNPVLQSRKFDPEGKYIREFVPELKQLDNDTVHEPWTHPSPPPNYPARIVDHAVQKEKALRLFRAEGRR